MSDQQSIVKALPNAATGFDIRYTDKKNSSWEQTV